MLNIFSGENRQFFFYSATLLGLGAIIYGVQKLKKQTLREIQQTKNAKIYNQNELHIVSKELKNKSNHQKNKSFYLLKVKASNIPLRQNQSQQKGFLNSKVDIYTNQIYFCPPSLDKILDQRLKEYHKEFSRIDKTLLTDKFQYETHFIPRQKYDVSAYQAQTFYEKAKDITCVAYQLIYSLRKNLWYYIQKPLQLLKIRKSARSYDKNRAPLFKGVFAGILSVNFKLLKNSYFLLKIKVDGTEVYPQLIAENKLMLINYEKVTLRGWNFISFVLIGLFLYNGYKLGKLFHSQLKKLWFRMTTFDKEILNPSGVTDDKLCQICYLNCRNVLFYSCRHFIVCDDCCQHLDKQNCIICNCPVQKIQPLYIKPN